MQHIGRNSLQYISPIYISIITDNNYCYSEIRYPHVKIFCLKCVTICFQFYQHDSSLIKDSVFAFTSFLGITVANESKSTVKNEALILLHALPSNEASKHDTCDTDKHNSRVNFPSSADVYACKSSINFFLLSKIHYMCLAFQQYKLQFS